MNEAKIAPSLTPFEVIKSGPPINAAEVHSGLHGPVELFNALGNCPAFSVILDTFDRIAMFRDVDWIAVPLPVSQGYMVEHLRAHFPFQAVGQFAYVRENLVRRVGNLPIPSGAYVLAAVASAFEVEV